MADFITASICVSDIPKDAIKVANNGKKYISIVIAESNEVDQYGNTHYIYMSQTKEEREAKAKRTYIGNGKGYQPQRQAPVSVEDVENMPTANEIDTSDLPF